MISVQVGDLIRRKADRISPTLPITPNKAYEVIKIENNRVYIRDDDGQDYPISNVFIPHRWHAVATTNESLLFMLKEG